MLATGGFTHCCELTAYNRSINLFDIAAYESGQDPWHTLVSHANSTENFDTTIQDYPHVFWLPQPVDAGGIERQVAIVGSNSSSASTQPMRWSSPRPVPGMGIPQFVDP